MPELQPSEAERLARLERELEQLRTVIELQRKIPKAVEKDADRLIIQATLLFIAAMVGVIVHRAIARNIYPSLTELGAIGASILLLRTDKATAADVSSAALRKILGIQDTQQ